MLSSRLIAYVSDTINEPRLYRSRQIGLLYFNAFGVKHCKEGEILQIFLSLRPYLTVRMSKHVIVPYWSVSSYVSYYRWRVQGTAWEGETEMDAEKLQTVPFRIADVIL